ncbi:MAG TPA: O-antigen ligase family protein [Steroidobacteraceae bacterium]|nr:O-antigen ligase family protein [Steroidobacteraceae bacterium]
MRVLRRTHAAAGDARYAPATGVIGDRSKRGATLMTVVIWLLTAVLVCPPHFIFRAAYSAFTESSGFLTGPGIFIFGLGAGAYVIVSRLKLAVSVLRQMCLGLLGLVVLATLSILWSADSGETSHQVLRLYALLLSAVAFTLAGWEPRRLQRVLRPVLMFLMVGSLLLGLLAPDLAIEAGKSNDLLDAWRGLTIQKNSLGALAAVGVLVWVHAWLEGEVKKWVAMAGMVASAACLLLSKSSTSLLATLATVPLLFLLLRTGPVMRRYMPYIVGVYATVVLVYSLAILNLIPGAGVLLERLTAITGRSMTFSGRIFIWNIMLENIRLHPLLGIGYGAFWTGAVPASPSYEFLTRLYFYPGESHNGYLDVINELGFAGGICLIAYLISFLRQSLRLFRVDRNQGALYLTMLFQGLMGNLSESHWFKASSFDFLFITMATAALARHLLELKRAGSSSAGLQVGPAAATGTATRAVRRRPLRRFRAGSSTV